jgi:DNA-binding MarR family transcriptional regulator
MHRRHRHAAVSIDRFRRSLESSGQTVENLVAGGTVSALQLEEFLPYRLAILSSVVSEVLGVILARHDLNMGDWAVLMTLAEAPQLTAKAVGARCDMHKTKVSRILAWLLRRKLISRAANPGDLRQSFLRLTPLGQQLYETCLPAMADLTKRLEAALESGERASLDRGLARLAQRSRQLIADPFVVGERQGRG